MVRPTTSPDLLAAICGTPACGQRVVPLLPRVVLYLSSDRPYGSPSTFSFRKTNNDLRYLSPVRSMCLARLYQSPSHSTCVDFIMLCRAFVCHSVHSFVQESIRQSSRKGRWSGRTLLYSLVHPSILRALIQFCVTFISSAHSRSWRGKGRSLFPFFRSVAR